MIKAALLALIICVQAWASLALDLRSETYNGRPILMLHGEFERGDSERVERFLHADPATQEVQFHSPGGLLSQGIAVGQVLRKASIATRVPASASCISACVWAFLGGVLRAVDDDAKVGVHMASMMFNEDLIVRIKNRLVGQSRDDMDVPLRIIMAMTEKAAARAAADKAEHLVRMGVSLRLLAPGLATDHWQVHWLTQAELRDYNVVNID